MCVCRCKSKWFHCPPKKVLTWLMLASLCVMNLLCCMLPFGWVGPCWCLVSSLCIYDFY
jgi:hypothetical protein